jgi:hypothetical protein
MPRVKRLKRRRLEVRQTSYHTYNLDEKVVDDWIGGKGAVETTPQEIIGYVEQTYWDGDGDSIGSLGKRDRNADDYSLEVIVHVECGKHPDHWIEFDRKGKTVFRDPLTSDALRDGDPVCGECWSERRAIRDALIALGTFFHGYRMSRWRDAA